MGRALELDITPVDDVASAVADAEVVVTCIPITHEPVVKSRWLGRTGSTLFNIGACEFEPELMARMDRIVVNSWPHALHRGLQPPVLAVQRGILPRERVNDLAPILAGRAPGRRSPEESIFFAGRPGHERRAHRAPRVPRGAGGRAGPAHPAVVALIIGP